MAAAAKVVRDSIVVFGSSGFIGGRVCAEARRRGLNVIGVSRSGRALPYFAVHDGAPQPPGKITLETANLTEPETYNEHLARAKAVVIAVGSPPLPGQFVEGGTSGAMLANGTAVIKPIGAAKAAKVPKVVVVNASMPRWLPHISYGYAAGKKMAESAAEKFAGDGTSIVCLKPGVVFGTRHVGEAQVPLPLGLVFVPLRAIMRTSFVSSGMQFLKEKLPFLFENLLVEPVGVSELARTAVSLATEETGQYTMLGPDEIIKKSHAESLSEFVKQNH